jgi:Uma2 family endonuclease
MLALANATIDDTAEPAIEWIGGRPVQKLMPTDLHALLTGLFWQALFAWAKRATAGRGMVGNEWRYIIPSNAYNTETVVPDVSYLATYFDLPKTERRYPSVPPDIVVEVRSPDDRDTDVAGKRAFYEWWGVKLIIIADPERRTVETREANGVVTHLTATDVLTSRAFPTLTIDLRAIFAELDEPENA